MITSDTKSKIKGHLEGFVQGMIDNMVQNDYSPKELRPQRDSSKKGDLKPFHESLIPDGMLKMAEFERSFSTKLGTTFEECAKLIALDNHAHAERGFRVEGSMTSKAIKTIEEIANQIGSSKCSSNYLENIKKVIDASKGNPTESRKCIADLFIRKHDGTEVFIEIKSPKPNKGQCLEATMRLLQIYSLMYNKYPAVKAYYATAYNPYGLKKEEYKHSFALNYMDVDNQVLLGSEFWDLVGGKNTYDEILEIYREVGRVKGPDMIDRLALGY